MRRWHRWLIPITAMAALAAACGDDDDDGAGGATTAAGAATTAAPTTGASGTTAAPATTAASGGPSTTTAALELTEPVSIVGLYETTGESAAGQPYFADGGQMAIDEINAAGGVGGHPITYERIVTPLDTAGTDTATLEGLDKKPTVLVGLVSSNQVIAEAKKIGEAKQPAILFSAAPQGFKDYAGEGGVGNDYVFVYRPRNDDVAAAQAQYVLDTFKPTKVALQCVNNPFGTLTCDVWNTVLKDAGVEVVAQEKNEQGDTDLSAQVLAIKEADPDLIMDVNFPNPLTVFANQLVENAVTIPHFDGASAGFSFLSGQLDAAARDLLYGAEDCVPTVQQPEWTAKYKAKFGRDPNYAAAETYDAMYMVKDAVERAGSTDPEKVQDALEQLDYKGVCTTYKADAGNGLHHQVVITNYKGGQLQVSEEITLE
jgi:branched-chain amino acid transport system substrate-binding protein